MPKTLYLVPTPIGNLKDMTFRAIEVLRQVSLILSEDTRVSGKLLKHYEINTPQQAFHEHNQEEKLPQVLRILETQDVALISDAGTPGISDPGFSLVHAAAARDIQVIALPGATALIPALVASGLSINQFTFLGFLPKKNSQKLAVLETYQNSPMTLALYESPYRLVETLKVLEQVLGDRRVSIAREISKIYETHYRSRLSQAIKFFSHNQLPGEIVIIIAGEETDKLIDWTDEQVLRALKTELSSGVGLNQAAKNIAQLSGRKKSSLYQLGLDISK